MSCLSACGGDVQRAKELYDFLAEGIGDMPDYDIPQPTTMQQATKAISNIFGWVRENKGEVVDAWNFIQSMRGGTQLPVSMPTPAEIPPIPTE